MNVSVYPCDDLDRGLVADGVCGARPPLHDGGLVLVWKGEVVIEGVDRAVRCGAPLDLESRLDRALRGTLRWDLVMPTYVGRLEVATPVT